MVYNAWFVLVNISMLFCKFECLQVAKLNAFDSIANFKIGIYASPTRLEASINLKAKNISIPNSIQGKLSKNSSNEEILTQLYVNTMMLWRNTGSKLILNTPKINRNKRDLEILLFGLRHHWKSSIHKYCKYFFSIDQ